MEQYLTKKINTTDIDDFIKLEAIFDYELVSKDIRGNKTYLTFKRETSTPYFEKRNIHFYVNRCGSCFNHYYWLSSRFFHYRI